MKRQSYANHIRYYAPHHFVYYPVLCALLGSSIYYAVTGTQPLLWAFICLIWLFLFALAFMLRQHYALTLQNRIVRLELRYRYFTLTGERMELFEDRLTDAQWFALRFAPDTELKALVDRALQENLSGDAIKKAIVDWKADNERA